MYLFFLFKNKNFMEFKLDNKTDECSKLYQQILFLQEENSRLIDKYSVLKEDHCHLKEQYSELETNWNQFFIGKKGRNSHNSGKQYEIDILNILTKTYFNGNLFNIQTKSEIGKSDNDLKCNYKKIRDLSIEIKKQKASDWVQCTLQYDQKDKIWKVSRKSRLPLECISIFEDFIANHVKNEDIFHGDVPPFQFQNIMHDDWLKLKESNKNFKDQYFRKDVPYNIISTLYSAKGCHYIQISNFGLYHLEKGDTLNLGVPPFRIKSKLRLRVKVHEKKKGPNGTAILNATLSFMPEKLSPKILTPSKYSLDDPEKLPPLLVYQEHDDDDD